MRGEINCYLSSGFKVQVSWSHKRPSTREELQGQPLLEGVLGPMYDGVLNGKVVVRYEDQAVYDILSS